MLLLAGVSIFPEADLGWVNLLLDGGPGVDWISSVNVGGSKGCRISWIDFDEEATFFTWDEAGVFGFTHHLENSRISCTAYLDKVMGFTKIHPRS